MRLFITLSLWVTMLLSIATPSYSFNLQSIPDYTLRYAVTYRGTNLGELEIQIKKSSDRVYVLGETYPNALANLLGDGKVIEIIEYTEQGDRLLLTRLTETKGQDNQDIKQLRVDHDQQKLITQDQQLNIAKSDQIDAYTFPLLSILGLSDSTKGRKETLVSADKIRHYQYQAPSKETVSTAAGTFETIKSARTRTGSQKTISLWLTETEPIMPVQIQVDKNGNSEALISLIKVAQ